MITKIRRKFTKWYVRRGYIFSYRLPNLEPTWDCPWWVRPLLIFFSPSVYFMEAYGKVIADCFVRGMNEVKDECRIL